MKKLVKPQNACKDHAKVRIYNGESCGGTCENKVCAGGGNNCTNKTC